MKTKTEKKELVECTLLPEKQRIVAMDSIRSGECIEMIVRKAVNNVEPISTSVPIVYTDRKDGVAPQYDIRTDRWEIAAEAMGKVAQSQIAQREQWQSKLKGEEGGSEPIGTN